jgi:hypothetical protein
MNRHDFSIFIKSSVFFVSLLVLVLIYTDMHLDKLLDIYRVKDNISIYSEHLNNYSRPIHKHDNVAIVTYTAGEPVYFSYQNALLLSAHDNGIDRVLTYHPRDIDSEFFRKHRKIFSYNTGVGYWLWKPYVILDAMKRMPENSYILYLDRDCMVINDITPLLKLAEEYGRVLFGNKFINRNYTKRDTYILMDADNERMYNMHSLSASSLLLKNTAINRRFIEEWLYYCSNEQIVSDSPSKLGKELPEFFAHRHDQSILTILADRYKEEQFCVSYDETMKYILNNNNRLKNMFTYSQNRYVQSKNGFNLGLVKETNE